MLEFAGQLGPWTGLALALLFALGTWLVYRRESRRSPRFAILLPLVRVIVVMFIILMLTGPTLRHRTQIGEPSRVLVFIDGSQSMGMTDPSMELARKVLIARSRGLLADDAIDTGLYDVAQQLREARLTIEEAGSGPDKLDMPVIMARFQQQLHAAQQRLRQLNLVALPAPATIGTGAITREYWLDVPGDNLIDLTASPRFGGPPTGTHGATAFEAPANLGDHYGTRMRGYIHPPITGAYTFWIASAGPGELWLSESEDATAKRLIARVTTATKPREWKSGESQSALIGLTGGRRYYIEAIHKAGTGEDHLAVGWQLSIGAVERPIPGKRLSPVAALVGQSPAQQLDNLLVRFQREMVDPLIALIEQNDDDAAGERKRLDDLTTIAGHARRWETTLLSTFDQYARALVAADEAANGPLAAALAKVDQATRWERAQSLLLGDEGLIKALASKHIVDIHVIKDGQSQLLWSTGQSARPPLVLDDAPTSRDTDLTAGLRERAESAASAQGTSAAKAEDEQAGAPARTSIVLLSDGRQNVDASDPQAMAAILGERRIPIYTLGLGGLTRPEDLSIRAIEAPQSVFHEDRVQGEILIDDDMPPGMPLVVRIELAGRVIWQKNLLTERGNLRRVPFDFGVKDLVQRQAGAPALPGADVKQLSVPLAFTVAIEPLEGEAEKGNNTSAMLVQAVTEPRRVLIIDGRPRWETRYLRNLFTRDQRWQVNALVAGVQPGALAWRRGDESGAFPRDLQSLYRYDVIIFGDVPASLLSQEEMERLRDFVGERGGGMIFIDGQRDHLRRHAATPLGELLPVQWLGGGNAEGAQPTRLKLTPAGQSATPLRLLAEPLENAALWQEMLPPHWLAPVRELPGTQVLAQGVVGDQTPPAIVERTYGAGKVLYLAFDESWRWRYEVADLHHARFWNQIARHVGEQPYAVQDQFVKLDAGSPSYRPGDKAEIRARLRDREGRPMLNTKVQAILYRGGRRVAAVPLESGDGRGGSYRAETAALEPGDYEVGLAVAGLNEADIKARARFTVEAPPSIERKAVIMDEEVLKRMSQRSYGRYYREEEIAQLIARLEPASRGRIIVTETALWRSYWWFVPIMILLTMEWILRKRAGLL